MTDARTKILGDVRSALGRAASDVLSDADLLVSANTLIADVTALRPGFTDMDNRARFIARATSERLTATVDDVATRGDVPTALRRYLESKNLPLEVAIPKTPQLVELNWEGLAVRHEIGADEPVAVTLADCAIAETGTLVFTSGAATPTLFNFLPLHHVAVLDGTRILRHMEDYWADVRQRGAPHPRSTNLITGTSGTADIEAKNIRGAHGPRFLHIVICG